MENDKLMRKVISLLAIPVSPVVSFLFSMKYFSSLYGGGYFVLFGVFLNTTLRFLQREDITRMVDIYKQMSVYGTHPYTSRDLYFTSLCELLSLFDVSLYGALCVWSVIYYLGVWLVMRELVKGYEKSYVAILLVATGFLAIDPGWFSILRWGTAAFWSLYLFLRAKDEPLRSWKCYLPLLTLTVHFSFILPLMAFYAYRMRLLDMRGWMRLALATTPLPVLVNGVFLQNILRSVLPQGLYASFGMYATEARVQAMESAYHYGKYLYLPLLLMLVYMLYLQYKTWEEEGVETLVDGTLLGMAFAFLTAYNLSFFSWDLLIRFRTYVVLVMTIAAARYYYAYADRRIDRLLLPLLVAFLFYNYEFFVNTLRTRFVPDELLSLPYDAIVHCQERLAHIRSIYL